MGCRKAGCSSKASRTELVSALLDIEAIAELAALGDRFLIWKLLPHRKTGKPTKVPLRADTGKGAHSTDQSTWCGLDAAIKGAARFRASGVGFVFDAARDGIMGVDLDGCRDPDTGALAPWAAALVRELASYAEVSPSGTGVKIWARADPVPLLQGNEMALGAEGSGFGGKTPGVEIYATGRYFALTGQILDDVPDEVCDATEALERLAARVRAAALAKQAEAYGTGTGQRRPATARNGQHDSPFQRVNSAALANLVAWVPGLFPGARYQRGTGAWRVSSAELGRSLEEDLSLAPNGIRDFGLEVGRTPIGIVMEHGGAPDASRAAQWLAERLGIEWRARQAPLRTIVEPAAEAAVRWQDVPGRIRAPVTVSEAAREAMIARMRRDLSRKLASRTNKPAKDPGKRQKRILAKAMVRLAELARSRLVVWGEHAPILARQAVEAGVDRELVQQVIKQAVRLTAPIRT